jgi:acyl-[acyl-carrier-protein]-phospholipid O-acyltransferase/long-chain-fatty-acid--[acyl-carrier-protein] ligase
LGWLFRSDFRSFYFLNATQFLGALNDNVFKLLVIYLLINVQGPDAANSILSLAGAIFVIPFLLFSSSAGILADRMSKQTIIVYTKILEVLIMLFGLISIYCESAIGSYTALFFMATQSTLFGPSKFGIIPELVEEKMVSKANGSLVSFTYLAIIIGTFLASFLVDITNKNFVFTSFFCVLIALIGVLTSLGIKRTMPQNSPQKINPFFLYELYQTFQYGRKIPYLLTAVLSNAFFLFIGAFTQLNLIPFAMQSLQMSETGGGYLFLATAIGIAAGAYLGGQLSKERVEPGITCIAGFCIALSFFCLYLFSFSSILSVITLILLGLFGGAYLVPLDAFIQVYSPNEKRGQIIALTNFCSFSGVLLAAFFLYFLSEHLGLRAASGFAFTGTLTLLTNFLILSRFSPLFFPFFIRKVLKRLRSLRLASPIPHPSDVIILESNSLWDAIMLYTIQPNLRILLPMPLFRSFPWFNGLFAALKIVPYDLSKPGAKQTVIDLAASLDAQGLSCCVFIRKGEETPHLARDYGQIFRSIGKTVLFAHGKKERIMKRTLGIPYPYKQITMHFASE